MAGDRLPTSVDLVDLGWHRLRDIDRPEQIYQVIVDDLPQAFPPLRSLSTRRSNLPVQLTSFVGRERELTEVTTLIGRHRLVTLIGTGGTGKTRLMLEAAGRLLDRYADGIWLAELAPLGDPSQIASEVARAIGAPEVPGVPSAATVTAFLADKDLLLLLLDNAEHLVDGVATFAEQVLAHASGLHILTTSREALAVPGEAVLQLQSLTCPAIVTARSGRHGSATLDIDDAASTEAVRLFTERATTVDPSFTLIESNVASVVEICQRLDGIPLAIELAAARVSAMSPDEIATRLGDRFRLLAGGRRTAVPRQQTLHALIDWSWDLLNDEDRRLLRRLSVFTGGWTSAMAARVVGDGPDQMDAFDLVDRLTRLVDRSLVIVDRDTRRYRLLETIRQYAREQLIAAGEAPSVADRHFAAYAALAIEAEAPLRGPAMVDWLDRLDPEQDNLGSALEWGLEGEPWAAVRMATALFPYWGVRVTSEDNDARIVEAIEIARARVVGQSRAEPADQALAATLLGEAARLWATSGRATVAATWASEAMVLADASGDHRAQLAAVLGRSLAMVFSGQAGPGGSDVRSLFERATALAEQSDQWWVLALSSAFAGASLSPFDPVAGGVLMERGVDAARRSGSPYAIGASAMAQGRMLGSRRETDAAVAAFAVAIQRFSELGDERFVLACRSDMAHALRKGGRLDEALAPASPGGAFGSSLGSIGSSRDRRRSGAFVVTADRELTLPVTAIPATGSGRHDLDRRAAKDPRRVRQMSVVGISRRSPTDQSNPSGALTRIGWQTADSHESCRARRSTSSRIERDHMKRTLLLTLTAMAIAVSACATAASPSPSAAPSAAMEMGDIVETATEAGSFKTLLAAATAAGLVDTLKGDGPFTLFAPTDEAFAALPAGTLDGLLADPEALKKILLYHVVSGKVMAAQVVGMTSADSVEGSPIAISVKDGVVYLNDTAKVVTTDIEASNGVIHVIDQVILPPTN